MRSHVLLSVSLCSFFIHCGGSSNPPPPPPPPNCTASSPTESPALNPVDFGKDLNCDGINGDVNQAIFVDVASGNDSNAGDITHPIKTISAAIAKAQAAGKPSVYISAGLYQEKVIVSDGVSLYGAYSAANAWKRDVSYAVTVQNSPVAGQSSIALEGNNIITPTTISQITFHASTNPSPGLSTYGARLVNCPRMTLDHTTLIADNGGDGASGVVPLTPAMASPGSDGTTFTCSPFGSPGGLGGTGGGTGTRMGKNGGNGGTAGHLPGHDGAVIGSGGGTGGAEGAPGGDATLPTSFLCLPSGGAGGSGSSVTALSEWLSNAGSPGGMGIDGPGGNSGGGSGATQNTIGTSPPITLTFGGNGGGGGGEGGTGGLGGPGGLGGGASIAAFVLNTNGLTIQDCILTSGKGGNGGNGSIGGAGGPGGLAGHGGTSTCGGVKRGGNGSNGGAGCHGGGGGGGVGGSSYALYRFNSTVALSSSTVLTAGTAGAGGLGAGVIFPGGNGTAGAAGPIF